MNEATGLVLRISIKKGPFRQLAYNENGIDSDKGMLALKLVDFSNLCEN